MMNAGRKLRNCRNWCAHVRPTAVLGLGVLVLMCGPADRSQSGTPDPFGNSGRTEHEFPHRAVSNGADTDHVTTGRQRIAFNVERQKQIVADSDKLLKLARELNDEVAAGNTGQWTPDELDKIAEIEKLARRVKARMLDTADQPSAQLSQPPPLFH